MRVISYPCDCLKNSKKEHHICVLLRKVENEDSPFFFNKSVERHKQFYFSMPVIKDDQRLCISKLQTVGDRKTSIGYNFFILLHKRI